MEFCVTILLPKFTPSADLVPLLPLATRWGPAWRQGEEGSYSWDGSLFVRPVPCIPSVMRKFPHEASLMEWGFISIDGPGMAHFEANVNSPALADGETMRQHPLLSLLTSLLEGATRWIVCFQKDCEDIAVTYRRQSLPDLIETVLNAYRWNSEAPEKDGFCSICIPGGHDQGGQ